MTYREPVQADTTDIIAIVIALYQLFFPLVAALMITGLIMAVALNFAS